LYSTPVGTGGYIEGISFVAFRFGWGKNAKEKSKSGWLFVPSSAKHLTKENYTS